MNTSVPVDEVVLPIRNANCKCGFMGSSLVAEACEKWKPGDLNEVGPEDCAECGHFPACHPSDCADGER